jgi:hypothetical protein
MRTLACAAMCGLLVSGAAQSAAAQSAAADPPAAPPPDKSGFTLFDPTPAADLRALCTDRPTKSSGACTVDAGYFQVESDIYNIEWQDLGGVTTTTELFSDPTIKLGVTNTLDLELGMVPWEAVTQHDRRTGETMTFSGVGDLYFRAKLNLIGDDGGDLSVALLPWVKAPRRRRV